MYIVWPTLGHLGNHGEGFLGVVLKSLVFGFCADGLEKIDKLALEVRAVGRWGCDKFQRCRRCGGSGGYGDCIWEVREAERSKESVALEDVCTCAAPLQVIQL